jgi:hypothetical protein
MQFLLDWGLGLVAFGADWSCCERLTIHSTVIFFDMWIKTMCFWTHSAMYMYPIVEASFIDGGETPMPWENHWSIASTKKCNWQNLYWIHLNIHIYYTTRFYFPHLSLLAQPVTIFVYGPARYLHYFR